MKLLQDILFLIDQHILISLPNSSACAAGLPFFPLPEAKRGLEPLLKFRLLCPLGASCKVVKFHEDQSIDTSTRGTVCLQARFHQGLPVSLPDEPGRQCHRSGPSLRPYTGETS